MDRLDFASQVLPFVSSIRARRGNGLRYPFSRQPSGVASWIIAWIVSAACTANGFGQAESLHERIDRHAGHVADWMVGVPLAESQSLRRLSLDLRNVVPSSEELDAFAADASEGKWARWVDRFLADPMYRERMVDWYDKTLMQRRPYQHVDRATWLAYLRTSVDQKVPLDQWIRDWIQSVWWNRSQRGQQRFFLDRGGDSNAIARDLGRVLFGRDMQCAQCHDHPQLDDYLQIDYHGLLAFVSASSMAEGKTTDDKGAEQKLQMYIEKAAGDAPFESVFNKGVAFRTATRLPGRTEKLETSLAPDGRYQAQPMSESFAGVPAPPVASRRTLLASQLDGNNRAFAENWANRIWALMFGRGLVQPLDMHHFDNPACNPELLAAITDALIASNFDVSSVMREMALSKMYRRGRTIPLDSFANEHSVLAFSGQPVEAWSQQVAVWIEEEKKKEAIAETEVSAKHAMMDQASDIWREIQRERVTTRAELDAAETAFQDTHKRWNEALASANTATTNHTNLTQKIALLEEAATKLEQAKTLGDDAEIGVSIAATRTKAEALKGQLPGLETAAVAASTARDAAHQVREAERSKWQSIVDRLQPVEQRLGVADQAFMDARSQFQAARRQSAWHSRRIQQTQRLQQWMHLSREIESFQTERLRLAQSKKELEDQLVVLGTKQSESIKSYEELRTRWDAVVATKNELTAKLGAVLSQRDQLTQTKQSLIASSALLSEPTSIDGAVQALDQSIAMRMSQMDIMDNELKTVVALQAQMESTVNASRVQLALHEQLVMEHQSQRQQIEIKIAETEAGQGKLREECGLLRTEIRSDLESQMAIAVERPLSPEQFGLSMLMVTGQFPYYRQVARDELEKQSPLPADANDEQKRERELQATRKAMDTLQSNVDGFATLFASGVGQTSDEFFASPDQALFLSNGGSVYGWSAPNGSNITSQLVQAAEPNQLARLLTWNLLAREPNPIEQEWITSEFTQRPPETKPAIAQELVWGVLAGVEFRLYP
jgi:hypothetical protein